MWTQTYTPIAGSLPLSVLVAAIPLVVMALLLAVWRAPAWRAASISLAAAFASAAAAVQGANLAGAAAGRIFSEVHELALASGGRSETFAGLAGAGDLVATAIAEGSRNRRAGELVGAGMPPVQVEATVQQTAESLATVPLLSDALAREGIPTGRDRIARIMREEGLAGVRRERRTTTTRPAPARPSTADLVDRDFAAPAPDRLWVADITYVARAPGGFCYTAFVTDVFARRIVGWRVAGSLGADLALCCDFIVASEAASFVMSFILRGLVPDGGGMYFLPRKIGMSKAIGGRSRSRRM